MFVLLAIPIVIIGIVNPAQAVVGRQLIRPDRSSRPSAQLRRESVLAALEMFGLAGAAVGLQLDNGLLVGAGFIVGLGALAVIYLGRRGKPA